MARTIRETVESIVIAFVLAFLFRTFEAEAFVIPTGSMAPTLQGRHKDVACPECGYHYKVGALGEREDRNPDFQMASAICPMCRYELDLDTLIPAEPRTYQTFEGDRILVNKFAYDTGEPRRWDVVVFKYPEDAKTNYIKRLVGLPGEHVYIGDPGPSFRLPRDRNNNVIYTGDIYISTDGGKMRQIARKETPAKLIAMLQDVYDNDYVPQSLAGGKWPERWRPADPPGDGGWSAENGTRAFACEASAGSLSWLRYHHIMPDEGSWRPETDVRFVERAVADFYTYNTGDYGSGDRQTYPHWVGDLALECDVEVRNSEGEIVLELIKGGRQFQARLDIESGSAQLVIPGHASYGPKAESVIDGPGTYQLRFANVDEQLWLFVDDELVAFDDDTTYESLNNYEPMPADVSPAGIAASGCDVTVSHLRIKRDVFYTQGDPREGARNEIALEDKDNDEEDQFFMLGDNSPASKDGRLWGDVDFVERRLLIGQAVYIYWPHGIPASFSFPIKVFGSKKYVPFWPNFGRMHRVR